MQVQLIRHTPDPERTAAAAARLCYAPIDATRILDELSKDRADRLLRQILASGHHSVLEHASFTFAVSGISRVTSHQLVRHRLASYCIAGDAVTELRDKSRAIKRRTVQDLFDMKKHWHSKSRLRLVKLNCLDEVTGHIAQSKVRDVVYGGRKPCLEFEVEGGYRLRATKDHLFLSRQGWKRLEDVLQQGLDIAVNGIPTPDRDWLREEYLTKNRTRLDIAQELGVSDAWLGKVIRSMGLQKSKRQYPGRQPGYGRKGMFTPESLAGLSEQKRGPRNPQWKGGVTRRSTELRGQISSTLRKEVYERDDFTCRLCGERGGKLTLHHVVPVWQNEDMVADKQNLVTLCATCHIKINGHEHEYTDYFDSLEPVRPQPRTARRIGRTMATFRPITRWKPIGEIDTYDIVMGGPHHNFIANGIVTHNSQQSQRYISYDRLEAITPPAIAADPALEARYEAAVTAAHALYVALQEAGIAAEDARYVLPNATATNMVVSMNARELWHFFTLRCCNRAQWEIRALAHAMRRAVQAVAPVLFENAGPTCWRTACPEGPLSCGNPPARD